MEFLKWLMLAYGCGILAVVGILVIRALHSAEWRAAVAHAERELGMAQSESQSDEEDDWLVPEAIYAEPWGALFSPEQQKALEALRHSPLVTARRRTMTVDV